MRLTIRVLGLELINIEANTNDTEEAAEEDVWRDLSGGTTSSYPIGFTPSWGDQAWEPGVER